VSEIIKAYQDALTYMAIQVDLDRLSAESERINITLPKWLISAIDSSESNRSRFLAESAIRALSEQQGRKAG
ncbi:MAG: type II toxin-antitoxin system HicB family antitoxin, partial [Proteobacteria bacterium]|nr:type II toxin-antitoxin system HicB family antitoxin [Pseudomonadota bacterium]